MAGSKNDRASQVVRRSKRYRIAVKAFGLRVRALRQEREWTLDDASGHMNVELKHLQKIEAGQVVSVQALQDLDHFDHLRDRKSWGSTGSLGCDLR